MDVGVEEVDMVPADGEKLFGTNKSEEGDSKEDVVVKVKRSEVGEKEVDMFNGKPDRRARALVVFTVCFESKRGYGVNGSRDVIELAPHLDGRGGSINFTIGAFFIVVGDDEVVDG